MHQTDLGANCSKNRGDRVMSPEQFTQVIEAILAGKYSWACVLILRFGGYNPLHYIPYRTYNRLQKEHEQPRRVGLSAPYVEPSGDRGQQAVTGPQLGDLAYLEVVAKSAVPVRGGRLEQWLGAKIQRVADFSKGYLETRIK